MAVCSSVKTSCERRNELLDRALVVPTVATPGSGFLQRRQMSHPFSALGRSALAGLAEALAAGRTPSTYYAVVVVATRS